MAGLGRPGVCQREAAVRYARAANVPRRKTSPASASFTGDVVALPASPCGRKKQRQGQGQGEVKTERYLTAEIRTGSAFVLGEH